MIRRPLSASRFIACGYRDRRCFRSRYLGGRYSGIVTLTEARACSRSSQLVPDCDITDGRGPDACIDAVGMEAHASGVEGAYDRAKQLLKMETDRPLVLRDVIMACRGGGTVSIAGV